MIRLACNGFPVHFDRKATVVTPSPLLAAVAGQQFSEYQLSHDQDAWQRPVIYSLGAWLTASWQEARYSASDVPTLLSLPQERLLWQSVIEEQHPDLFDPRGTARLALRSAQVMAEWQISAEGNSWSDYQDAHQFQAWSKVFRRKCQEEGWITRSDLWRLLPKWISAGYCRPERIVFAGFDVVPPALENLTHHLGSAALIEPLVARPHLQPALVKRCADFNQEIEQAARWARAMFEQQPSRSVGIFVPDLSSHYPLLRRVFEQVFYPAATAGSGTRDSSAFHIVAKAALENHPLIASALLLLKLAYPRIHHADASAILRCPFIAGAAVERSARALADVRLRKLRELDVSVSQMERASNECAGLTRLWPAVRRAIRGRAARFELPAWSQFISSLLEAVGWPGDFGLTSKQQEVLESWKDALSRLASLGLVSGEMPYSAALAQLQNVLADIGVETGDWSSPIQILDAADASGIEFDRAFLTGLSDETWPPPVTPSPLIPLQLQRTHKVPGSSPNSVRGERERVTRSLFSTASVLFATYSGRPSPMIKGLAEETASAFPAWRGTLPRDSYAPVLLENIEDDQAPPYRPVEKTRGGTYIIKTQSQCPFRAFAEIRLNAETLEDGCFGLDARERGGLLHDALQSVWQQLQTQACLRATDDNSLREIVREAVAQAVKGGQGGSFHEQNSLAERERLEELILDWLRVERNRKQSFVVETTEQKRSFEIAGLELQVRIDRVDRLKNGKLVLIDYKSGEPKRKELEGARPKEPQLLVYAAALGSDVEGIFFGQLKPRDLRGVGFSRERHFIDRTADPRNDWASFMQESRLNIERIARGFVEGYAAVDPLPRVCDYCGIKPLCRISEVHQRAQEDEG